MAYDELRTQVINRTDRLSYAANITRNNHKSASEMYVENKNIRLGRIMSRDTQTCKLELQLGVPRRSPHR